MHKLTLDDTKSTPPTTQPVVDSPTQVSNNQTSSTQPTARVVNTNQSNDTMNKAKKPVLMISLAVALLLGIATGYGTYQLSAKSGVSLGGSREPIEQTPAGTIQVGDVFGSQYAEDFPDSAQGYLEAGGINGEGSHKLLRPGGETQTVYLTSSVTDLEEFVGMDIKVWGETFKGQSAGWLMDVGRVEVLSLEGEVPTEE